MRILITGGGTAGHVTPLLAVASKIKEFVPSSSIRYVGERSNKAIGSLAHESLHIEKSYFVYAGKLRRFYGKPITWYLTQPKLLLLNIRDMILLGAGTVESLIHLIIWRPDVVFAKGGYVSLPVGLASAILRIPLVIHDSDTLPGLTNRILSRFANKIGVGQPVKYYPMYQANKLVFCGIPINEAYYKSSSKKESKKILSIAESSKVIVIIGGSLGAVRLNQIILKCLDQIMQNNLVNLIWISGSNNYSEIQQFIKNKKFNNRILLEKFTKEMPEILNAADVVVSRAGATSLAELAALAKPTILVPNPLLTGGHQVANAKAYSDNNAALVLREDTLVENPSELVKVIHKILTDNELKRVLSNNISKYFVKDSSEVIAKLVISASKKAN